MWGLEASLVDVVEGEGLGGVCAVFIHFHRRLVASLGLGLSLRLLPSRCHNLRQGEGHGTRYRSRTVWRRATDWVKNFSCLLFLLLDGEQIVEARGEGAVRRPAGVKLSLSNKSQ